jgi:hypothetical protein
VPRRRLGEAVGVEAVHVEGAVERVIEPLLGGERGQPSLHLLDLGGRIAVREGDGAQLTGAGLAEARRLGLQLEGAPGHLGGAVEIGERGLEPALAEVAPGTDHVADDVDHERFGHCNLRQAETAGR